MNQYVASIRRTAVGFIFSLYLVIPIEALACRVDKELTPEQRENADFVFVGEPLAVSVGSIKETLQIDFSVNRVERGIWKTPKIQVLLWGGVSTERSMTIEEFRTRFGSRLRVGVATAERLVQMLQCKRAAQGATKAGPNAPRDFKCPQSIALPMSTEQLEHFLQQNAKLKKPLVINDVCSPPFIERVP